MSLCLLFIHFPSDFAVGIPALDARAAKAVERLREARAKETGSISPEWGMEEWLYSLRARIAWIKKMGDDAREAGKAYCRALWPEEPIPETTEGLLNRLHEAQDRMIEWRESAARVGVDEALCWLLSIYENLDLDKVVGVRLASKWITDPEFVEKRERKAQLITEGSDLHEFRLHPDATPEEKEAARSEERRVGKEC